MTNVRARGTLGALLRVALFALAAAVLGAGSASASVTPTFNLSLTNPQLGAHSDAKISLGFDYGGDDASAYPEGEWRETVKNLVVDIPPGLVGNPNAVPFEERCDVAAFDTDVCPPSSIVGTIEILTTLLGTDQYEYPLDLIHHAYYNRVALLKTEPEVPATIGLYISLPGPFYDIRQTIQIAPDTGDLKLRTVTLNPLPKDAFRDTEEDPRYSVRVNNIDINFFGVLPNGNAFMTNPTNCEPWKATAWATAYFMNANADSDPLLTGVNTYKSAQAAPIQPDCGNQSSIPFPISGTTKISSAARDVSPDFDFTITNPGVQANGQVSTTPRNIVTTVPASINVDVQQLTRICTNAAFETDTCPPSTRVGTVAIETPLIRAGLSGDVYLTQATPGLLLPDLGMKIRGAINFSQRGLNRYVGIKGNQIQTSFTNIPQVGFRKLNVHLFGGPNGLLRSLKCPTSNKQPQDGSFNYNFTAYSGATAASTTDPSSTPCFGIQKLRTFKCVYKLLRFQPTYTSRARIKQVVLFVDGKKITTVKKGKFQFRVPAKHFKKGKHKFELRATYDDGTVSKKKSRFRRC